MSAIKARIDPISAHLFLLYFGTLSMITTAGGAGQLRGGVIGWC